MSEEALLKDFKKCIADQKFTFQDDGELKLNELSEIADKSNYSKVVMDEIGNLRSRIETDKASAIDRNKSEALRGLKMEIMSRYGGETGRIEASIDGDLQLQAAKGLLLNQKKYKKLLGGK
jgi:carboxyl-terminal processing protease